MHVSARVGEQILGRLPIHDLNQRVTLGVNAFDDKDLGTRRENIPVRFRDLSVVANDGYEKRASKRVSLAGVLCACRDTVAKAGLHVGILFFASVAVIGLRSYGNTGMRGLTIKEAVSAYAWRIDQSKSALIGVCLTKCGIDKCRIDGRASLKFGVVCSPEMVYDAFGLAIRHHVGVVVTGHGEIRNGAGNSWINGNNPHTSIAIVNGKGAI